MRALIVLGGDMPTAALLERCMKDADLVIAADRGLAAFDAAGLEPDMAIGDMDSVPADVLARYGSRLPQQRLSCIKDDTDGEAALNLAIERGAKEVIILGALGGRLDHALANLMLLVRAHNLGAFAQIADERVRIFRVDGRAEITGAKGDTVSLLPLGQAKGVTISGFFYPLENYTLRNDQTLGMSNVVSAETASVTVASGDLLLFHYYGGC